MLYQIPEWCHHPPDATTPALLSSYQKAPHRDLTPLVLDKENATAQFVSRHGHYFVTLTGCPCGSNTRPCKHMYRLAMELGLMPGTLQEDHTRVMNRYGAYYSGVTDESFRSLLDGLDRESQLLLYQVSINCQGMAGSNYQLVLRSDAVDTLILSGLLDEILDNFTAISVRFSCEIVRALLSAAKISIPDNVLKKGSHLKQDGLFLQTCYEKQPELMRNLFAVVDGTALLYDRRETVIRRIVKLQNGGVLL